MKEPKLPPSPYIVLEGNIGVGKSTLLTLLGEQFPISVIPEPHYRWSAVGDENILDLFYKDSKRWAYTFQSYAFITRMQEMLAQQAKHPQMMHVLERSVFSDRYCFAALAYELGNMSLLEWEIYQEIFAWLVDSLAIKPYGIIYIQADPQVCYERISKRSRQEERNVPLEYIVNLHKKHEAWLLGEHAVARGMQDVPLLVINGDVDFEQSAEHRTKIFHDIQHFLETISASKMQLDCVKSLSL